MDTQNSSPVGSSKAGPEIFDDIDFKLLSDGLGFHHGNKAEEVVKTATRTMVERSTTMAKVLPRPSHPFEQHRLDARAESLAPATEYVQNDLALFYKNQAAPVAEAPVDLTKSVVVASKPLRLAAFVVDFLIVASLCVITIQAVSMMTGLRFWEELFALDSLTASSLGVLFSSYFLLYFTILEKFQGRSIGKDLFGITLAAERSLPMTTYFARALLTLVGFLSLGLTNYVDLPGTVTATRVVKL